MRAQLVILACGLALTAASAEGADEMAKGNHLGSRHGVDKKDVFSGFESFANSLFGGNPSPRTDGVATTDRGGHQATSAREIRTVVVTPSFVSAVPSPTSNIVEITQTSEASSVQDTSLPTSATLSTDDPKSSTTSSISQTPTPSLTSSSSSLASTSPATTTTTSSTSSPSAIAAKSTTSTSKMSGGSIAAGVVLGLAFFAGISFLAFLYLKRCYKSRRPPHQDDQIPITTTRETEMDKFNKLEEGHTKEMEDDDNEEQTSTAGARPFSYEVPVPHRNFSTKQDPYQPYSYRNEAEPPYGDGTNKPNASQYVPYRPGATVPVASSLPSDQGRSHGFTSQGASEKEAMEPALHRTRRISTIAELPGS